MRWGLAVGLVGALLVGAATTGALTVWALGHDDVGCGDTGPLAAYEWQDDRWRSGPGDYDATLVALHERCVRRLYVDVTRAAALAEASDDAGLVTFAAALDTLVQAAAARGVAVEALAGDPHWSAPGAAGPVEVVAFVAAFNAEPGRTVPLVGLQFDVEPWGLPDWEGRRDQHVAEYLDLVAGLVASAEAGGLGVPLGFAVPYWFDGSTDAVGTLRWGGRAATPVEHLLDVLAPSPGAYLAVMASRNTAGGEDGAVAVLRGEVDLARAHPGGTRIVATVETGDVTPQRTTYHGAEADALLEDVAVLRRELGDEGATFAGAAVNDVPSLLALR